MDFSSFPWPATTVPPSRMRLAHSNQFRFGKSSDCSIFFFFSLFSAMRQNHESTTPPLSTPHHYFKHLPGLLPHIDTPVACVRRPATWDLAQCHGRTLRVSARKSSKLLFQGVANMLQAIKASAPWIMTIVSLLPPRRRHDLDHRDMAIWGGG